MLCSGQVPPKSPFEVEDYERNFEEVPTPFTSQEREDWLSKLEGVVVSSDAFVSFLWCPYLDLHLNEAGRGESV